MVLAGLLGALLTLGLLRSAGSTRPVLVAARDLVPGTVVDEGALAVARLDAGDELIAHLFPAGEAGELHGLVVTAPVARGAPVTRDDLGPADAGAAPRAMSFAVARADSVGGELRAGDRVDVLGVDAASGGVRYVLTDTALLAADHGDGGPLGGDDAIVLTVALDPAAALRLAGALEAGPVRVVRATGARPLREAPAVAGAVGGDDG